jgi:hypothetical protein
MEAVVSVDEVLLEVLATAELVEEVTLVTMVRPLKCY